MNQDDRCCGTGTCIINAEGFCWCGQQWNGTTMCQPAMQSNASTGALAPNATQVLPDARQEGNHG